MPWSGSKSTVMNSGLHPQEQIGIGLSRKSVDPEAEPNW